jgi:hypothetical protein
MKKKRKSHVKIFDNYYGGNVEKPINEWIDQNSSYNIIDIRSACTDKRIFTTILYEK